MVGNSHGWGTTGFTLKTKNSVHRQMSCLQYRAAGWPHFEPRLRDAPHSDIRRACIPRTPAIPNAPHAPTFHSVEPYTDPADDLFEPETPPGLLPSTGALAPGVGHAAAAALTVGGLPSALRRVSWSRPRTAALRPRQKSVSLVVRCERQCEGAPVAAGGGGGGRSSPHTRGRGEGVMTVIVAGNVL